MHSPRRGCEPERGSRTLAAGRHRRRRRRRGLRGPRHRGLLLAGHRRRQQLGDHPPDGRHGDLGRSCSPGSSSRWPASSRWCRASGSGWPSRPTASCATRSPATSSAAKDFMPLRPAAVHALHADPVQQRHGRAAVRAVPDDEPHRVPDRADPDRLRRLPHGRASAGSTASSATSSRWSPRACRCGCARSCSSSRCSPTSSSGR